MWRKTYDVGLICALDLFMFVHLLQPQNCKLILTSPSTASSTAGAAAAAQARHEYELDYTYSTFCFVTL